MYINIYVGMTTYMKNTKVLKHTITNTELENNDGSCFLIRQEYCHLKS